MAGLPPGSLDPVALLPFIKTPVSKSLRPRAMVKLDGRSYIPQRYQITSNGHGATDSASFEIPITGNPDWTVSLQRGDDTANTNAPVLVEILADPQNTGAFQRRFYGIVADFNPDFDPGVDSTMFNCLSLGAPLTSNKITTPFGPPGSGTQNSLLTTDFVTQQAARFGLGVKITLGQTTDVSGATVTQEAAQIKDVLGSEFVTGVRNWVIWDLMLQCAQYDDVDIWVDKNGILHYEAASEIKRPIIQYKWGQNITTLKGKHSPQFSKNIRVEVRSYVKKTRTSTTSRVTTNPGGGIVIQQSSKTVTSSPEFGTATVQTTTIDANGNRTVSVGTVTGGSSNSGAQSYQTESGQERYIFYVKNKTPQQCDDLAQRIWRQISQHENAITMTVPVTEQALADMDVTAAIVLFGVSMAKFNDEYWPRQIVEKFDCEQGWEWDIDAVNHSLAQGAV